MRLYSTLCVAILVAFSLCGCATVYNPATERKEIIFITTPMEVTIGNQVAAKVAQEFKFTKDKSMQERVTAIGQKIAAMSDRRDLAYSFTVIEDKELNAFTIPGGHIYVNSGLVEKSTDDELACVIGHEVGHVAARHITKKMQTQLGYDIIINIAANRAGIRDMQKVASIGFDLIMLGYSREDELFSDRLGVKYAYKAGYDPYAMISFMKKLQETKDVDIGPVFLRSHPYVNQRIEMLKKETPAIVEKADKTRNKESNIPQVKENAGSAQPNSVSMPIAKETQPRPVRVMCPVCRRIFPGATRYCPYDGTKLP